MTEQAWLTSTDPAALLAWLQTGQVWHSVTHASPPCRPSDRKLRLFATACCRLTKPMYYPEAEAVVRAAEAVAEKGVLSGKSMALMRDARQSIISGWLWCATSIDVATALRTTLGQERPGYGNGGGTYLTQMADLLRCVAGNPFRPVTLPDDEGPCPDCSPDSPDENCDDCGGDGVVRRGPCPWLTPQVLSLAQAAYDERGGTPCPGTVAGPCCQTRLCPVCPGTGVIGNGTLDNARLAVLSDALEEAGCDGTECEQCDGRGSMWRCKRCRGHWMLETRKICPVCPDSACAEVVCTDCGGPGFYPHPLLEHLRSSGPHVRGCHAIDLLMGRE